MAYQGLILDFGGVLTTDMKLNGQAFEHSEGLAPGAYFAAIEENPEEVRVYADLEVGRATQEEWNAVVGVILGIDPTDLMRRALANLRPEPAIVAATQRARAAGIKVAMLFNSFGLEPFNIYQELGLDELFDAVILSELEQIRTPATEILRADPCRSGSRRPRVRLRRRSRGEPAPSTGAGDPDHHHFDAAVTVSRLDAMLHARVPRTRGMLS